MAGVEADFGDALDAFAARVFSIELLLGWDLPRVALRVRKTVIAGSSGIAGGCRAGQSHNSVRLGGPGVRG